MKGATPIDMNLSQLRMPTIPRGFEVTILFGVFSEVGIGAFGKSRQGKALPADLLIRKNP
jgi:hypothetical protein